MATMTGSFSESSRLKWQTIVISTLAFWLSGSLLLDLIIMPEMYVSGMMAQDNFAATGYSLFWTFNRIELLCSAVVLTGILVLQKVMQPYHYPRWAVGYAIALLLIPVAFTYILTPAMSGLGLHAAFSPNTDIPAGMDQLHGMYWMLEMAKLGVSVALLRLMTRLTA